MDSSNYGVRNRAGPPYKVTLRSNQKSLQRTQVTIKVGPDGEPFDVPRAMLIAESEYFRSVTNFFDKKNDEILLPDLSENEFFDVLEWFYKGPRHLSSKNPEDLAEIFKSAESLRIPLLKTQIIEHISTASASQSRWRKLTLLNGLKVVNAIFRYTNSEELIQMEENLKKFATNVLGRHGSQAIRRAVVEQEAVRPCRISEALKDFIFDMEDDLE